jgi:hypothetical protein
MNEGKGSIKTFIKYFINISATCDAENILTILILLNVVTSILRKLANNNSLYKSGTGSGIAKENVSGLRKVKEGATSEGVRIFNNVEQNEAALSPYIPILPMFSSQS